MENPKAGVRKGAWTKEEDILLTKCIHKFGEGRWHLVPLRSGLNRCRKSCRLRWLNYLNPNVKRGLFTQDEVDLIMRMHKLLGNRWSLIAGRIPGRTANDIKNFWNTHIQKNSSSPVASHLQKTNKASDETERSNNINNNNNNNNNVIIRPQPRNMRISSSNNLTENEIPTNTNTQQLHDDHEVEECMRWWADLLNTCSSEKDSGPFSFPEDKAQQPMLDLMNHRSTSIDNDGGYDLDVDAMWELLNMDV